MNPKRLRAPLYLICSVIYGFVLCLWLVFLIGSLDPMQGVDSLWVIAAQIVVVCVALLASVLRKPKTLLVSSLLSFFPLGLYLFGGEGIAQLGSLASLTGLVISIAIVWQHIKVTSEVEKVGS